MQPGDPSPSIQTRTVEFLFSTVDGRLFGRDPGVLERADFHLVIDQSEDGPKSEAANVFRQAGRGLSRSRNAALERARGDWCFLCDDDIDLVSDAPQRIQRELRRRPDADIVLFAVLDARSGRTIRRPPRAWLPRSARILSACSIQIAFRRQAVLAAGLRFDERFGLGAPHPSGEEAIFLSDALRAGLRIEWSDVPVAIHPEQSSGSDYRDSSLALTKGAVLARIFGPWRAPWMLAFAWHNYGLYRDSMSPLAFLADLERGARAFRRRHTSWSRPGSGGLAGSAESGCFDALCKSGVRYAVWKDVDEVNAFAHGNSELDLYVAPADRSRFAETARRHGFAEFTARLDTSDGEISHFLCFRGGRVQHLHAHSALQTGDHYAKELCLDAALDGTAFEGPDHGGIRVLPPTLELRLGLLRALAKMRWGQSLSAGEAGRLRAVAKAEGLSQACSALELRSGERSALEAWLLGDEGALEGLDGSRALRRFERLGRFRALLTHYRVRLSNAWAGFRGLGNKRAPGRAPRLALIGVDGSGKSEVAERMRRLLATKVSVRHVYLGGNPQTYSPATRVASLLWLATEALRRAWPRRAILEDVALFSRTGLEAMKARDRASRIRRAERAANRGVVVLYERFPLPGLFDVPYFSAAGAEPAGFWARGAFALMRRVERQIQALPLPDRIVLLRTSAEVIEARRRPSVSERKDIEWKLDRLARFEPDAFARDRFVELRNDGAIDDTLEELCEILEPLLCSSNS